MQDIRGQSTLFKAVLTPMSPDGSWADCTFFLQPNTRVSEILYVLGRGNPSLLGSWVRNAQSLLIMLRMGPCLGFSFCKISTLKLLGPWICASASVLDSIHSGQFGVDPHCAQPYAV